MARILAESRRSLLDLALVAIAFLLIASGLLLLLCRWLGLNRSLEEAAYLGIYAAAGSFALFLAFTSVAVLVSFLSALIRRRGNGRTVG
jgi:hypothetical protein